jgi:hypothetical protein
MSDFNKNSDNQEFIKKLELLRDLEAEKPVEEMDVSLVMACVELILELRGETVNFTPEEVEEKVRKIPFVEETTTLNTPPQSVKGRSTKVKSRKILLIAAIISILIAIFAVTSIAFEWNIFDELKEKFGTVAETPINEEIDVDGISVFVRGENKNYANIEQALMNENIDILFPKKLPEGIVLKEIVAFVENGEEKIHCSFNDSKLTLSVAFETIVPNNIKSVATEKLFVNDLECYLIDASDVSVVQIYFEYAGNLYRLKYNNKQDLLEIIENLMELQ